MPVAEGQRVQFLRDLFSAAVLTTHPAALVPAHLPPPPAGRTLVLGAGKASAAMARAVEEHWPPGRPLSGLVVTRYGHGAPCRRIEVVEAGHPVPDAVGASTARRLLAMANEAGARDLVLALFSGGGSSLLGLPLPGLGLEELRSLTGNLLRSGASIADINTVRKHLSAVAGGRLAAACHPAPVVTLLISDVPGDDPSLVASGPTVPDCSSAADAQAILHRFNLAGSHAVRRVLCSSASGTPKPGDPRFARNRVEILATSGTAVAAAARLAEKHGVAPVVLRELEGEAERVGREMASAALARAASAALRRTCDREPRSTTLTSPCVMLSGGETTVTVSGSGRGGRNSEFLLSLAIALNAHPRIWAIAADTDGIDGDQEAAGSFITPDTLARARAIGLDASAALAAHDSGTFFSRLGDVILTGPTRTNVNDFRAVLIA